MTDSIIRPGNSLLLVALQSAEGTPATPSAATDAIPVEVSSIDYNGPYRAEQTDEANGSFAAGAPMVVGQPATVSFRSRIKGAGIGAVYSSTVKPPLHAPLSACGWLGLFTAAVTAAALTAGTASSGTLGTGFGTVAQAYRGQPLTLTGSPAAGRKPLISDYTAGKVATLTDLYGSPLTVSNTAAIPANWTYGPTSPSSAADRATMHPCATIYLYEDGNLHQWTDCRGTVDFDGDSGKPGMATFNFTGVYAGISDAAVPTNVVYPGHSAPLLAVGTGGVGQVFQINRRGLPISKWSLRANSQIETPSDPNTTYGFASGSITDRMYVLAADPKRTLVATRNVLADIGAFSQYPGALWFPGGTGNSVGLTLPVLQPTDVSPARDGNMRSDQINYQALNPGKDGAGRDGDAVLVFA